MPFIQELTHWAAVHGDRTAIVVGEQRLSYAQLLEAARAQPQIQGIGAAPIVTIDVPPSAELAVSFCSAALHKNTVMVLDAQWPDGVRAALLRKAAEWASRPRTGQRPPDVFLLGLSSGTSGVPKAFLRSANSWHESFKRSVDYFGVGEETVTLAPGPMAASMNLYALGESLFSGSTFLTLPQFSPDAALRAMREYSATRLVLVPTILGLMAARGIAMGIGAEQITSIVCAGSELPEGLLALAREWAPNALIRQYYGAAELGFVTADTMKPAGAGAGAGEQGVGRAFPGVQIAIRDETGKECVSGQQGDVWVQGPYACDSYAWGDDGLAFTAQAAPTGGADTAQRWCTVRDQGYLDAQGRLHLAGRASDMVTVSGANVYPHHVEQLLTVALATKNTAAATVIVAGVPDAIRGQRLIAGCYRMGPIASTNGTDDEHLDALRRSAAQLPDSHRPREYYLLMELPLTGSGKISRAMLSQWITEGDPRAQRLR